MDFDALRDVKSGLGTAAVIVMNKQTGIPKKEIKIFNPTISVFIRDALYK
jgi:NADH:ubiquinone oxidoreductase subunit F (NADH-binding)